jgi:hypothetical protein
MAAVKKYKEFYDLIENKAESLNKKASEDGSNPKKLSKKLWANL